MPEWDRFTEGARRVIFFSQEEAHQRGDSSVSTEHLLLGLLREERSVANEALGRLGVARWRLRVTIRRQVLQGPGSTANAKFTPQLARAVEFASEEARQLNHEQVGVEHLLLGILHEGDCPATQLLTRLGANLARVRAVVAEIAANG